MSGPVLAAVFLIGVAGAFTAGRCTTRTVEPVARDGEEHVNTSPRARHGGNAMPMAGVKDAAAWDDVDGADASRTRARSRPAPGSAGGSDTLAASLSAAAPDRRPDGSPVPDVIHERVEALIDELEPVQLEHAVMSLTGMSAEQLARIQDLRDFASRLAGIAMMGVLSDTPGSRQPSEKPVAVFTRDVPDFHRTRRGETVFDTAAGRIHAMFPSDGYEGDSVLMKWYTPGRPGDAHVRVHPVLQGAPFNYVWAEVEAWPPGLYQVEIYSMRESLELLAAGTYQVRRRR